MADLPAMAGAFVANSHGVAPVSQVDEVRLPVDDRLMGAVIDRFNDVGWDGLRPATCGGGAYVQRTLREELAAAP